MSSGRAFGLVVVAALAVVAALVACGGGGFDPASKVDSVRLFVVKADKPYAKPGETVTLEALLTDARRDKPVAAKLYWIPILCLNPQDDLYYLCFANPGDASNQAGGTRLIPLGPLADAGAADAGAAGPGGNPFASIPTGVDLAPFLPQGPTFSFRMPDDAVKERAGSDPYGLAVVFNVLCAGRIEFLPRDPAGGPQQVPVVCSDENGVKLPPSDYVIGISRVYSFTERVNTNPVLEKVTFEGNDVDLAKGITFEKCTAEKEKDCKENKIDVRVSDSSWESNPADVTRDGELREQIWVDYYSDIGKFDDEARLLFDTRVGRVSDSDVKFRAPKDVTDGTLWAVVHDNRGGAAWVVVPLHVR
ncbi:MAG TPA: hypothetical protein VLT33_22735 [Labilithrix sp.]|nr:hypothetical protein [Labilithrix sp.]